MCSEGELCSFCKKGGTFNNENSTVIIIEEPIIEDCKTDSQKQVYAIHTRNFWN
jgi:hypothetical protein